MLFFFLLQLVIILGSPWKQSAPALPEVTQVLSSNCHVPVVPGPGAGSSASLFVGTCTSGLCDMCKYAEPFAFGHPCLDGMSTLLLDSRKKVPPPIRQDFVGQLLSASNGVRSWDEDPSSRPPTIKFHLFLTKSS